LELVMPPCRQLAQELTDKIFRDDGPGFAVGVFTKGKLVEKLCRGRADLDKDTPIDHHTAFHAASLSKQFTAYAIALLLSERKIGLDSEIGAFLPFLRAEASHITIAQLLYHTSGLSDQWVLLNLAGWTEQDIIYTHEINRLISRQTRLKYPRGRVFSYTNTGYTFLAEIVQTATGRSIEDYLNASLFRRLAMSHTRFRADFRSRLPYEAECYTGSVGTGYVKTTPRFATAGATSLQTSLVDLALWANHLLDPNPSETGRLMQSKGHLNTGESIPYGFGLYHGIVGGIETLSHSGWDADFSAYVIYLPRHDVGAAIFSNGTPMTLELIATAFLTQYVDFGPETARIERRLLALDRGRERPSSKSPARAEKTVYGSIESGDIRIWERDEEGQRLRYGIVQDAEAIDEGVYTLGASLSTAAVQPEELRISSPTQNLQQTFPRMAGSPGKYSARQALSFHSEELQATHVIIGDADSLLWIRPGRRPLRLDEIGDGWFYAEGFSLLVSHENLIILNARSDPIRLAPRPHPLTV
jgi:CubicO group peptidase (beta-lactamase class C family)